MTESRKTKFKVKTTNVTIKNAIIAAVKSDEAKQVSQLKCGHIIAIVKMFHKFKKKEIINGIKHLANDNYIQLGKGRKFLSRQVLKSSITPNEWFKESKELPAIEDDEEVFCVCSYFTIEISFSLQSLQDSQLNFLLRKVQNL